MVLLPPEFCRQLPEKHGTGDLSRLPPALKIGPCGFLFCYWFCNREVRTFPNLSETEGWSISGVGLVKQSVPDT